MATSDVQAWRARFLAGLDAPMLAEQLFAAMPDVVFCLKDLAQNSPLATTPRTATCSRPAGSCTASSS